MIYAEGAIMVSRLSMKIRQILYFFMTTIDDRILIQRVKTQPVTDPKKEQKPGTSGLRKKVAVFQEKNYVENFIQSYFNALRRDALSPNNKLMVGGDGRYFSREAISVICQIACANGVNQLHVAKDGLMSTPACSAYIRNLNEMFGSCLGGILLTASHNPGGPKEDFGIKFNSRNGGPALEELTDLVHKESLKIHEYKKADYDFLSKVDLSLVGDYHFTNVQRPFKPVFTVKVVENVRHYVDLMKKEFNFEKIKALLHRSDFKMVFDGLHGAAGPYAKAIFEEELGNKVKLSNCVPAPDFNGAHPDPNLVCAHDLVVAMGYNSEKPSEFDFGAACDGDADRNMILGKNFFVTPSDSLAVLASLSHFFLKEKLKGVARSMPTSGAVDNVAKKLGFEPFETPTGWKFFGNLMEDDLIGLCGQESFGTGSPHVREKDGLWTVLAWLQVLARSNQGVPEGKLVSVEDILRKFWAEFGRNYYCRYDFESIPDQKGKQVWEAIEKAVKEYAQKQPKGRVFNYVDPVDFSQSKNQGFIFSYPNGSRVVFRKSGTGSSGMTLRIYYEKYEQAKVLQSREEMLKELIELGLKLSQVRELSGKKEPDVIT